MAKYKIAITRTETQVFTIEADNSTDAIQRISEAWDEGRIELYSPELCDTDFSLIGRT